MWTALQLKVNACGTRPCNRLDRASECAENADPKSCGLVFRTVNTLVLYGVTVEEDLLEIVNRQAQLQILASTVRRAPYDGSLGTGAMMDLVGKKQA